MTSLIRSFLFPVPVIAILFFSYSHADDGRWEKIDVSYYRLGKIEEISIGHVGDSESQRIIFAASASDSCWLWKSTNDGVDWERNHYVEDNHFHTRVVIQETDFDQDGVGWTLVPSDDGNSDDLAGPYRTINGATTWDLQDEDSDLDNFKKLHALAVDQSSTDLETAFIGGEGNSGNLYKRLYKTTDGGTNWNRVDGDLPAIQTGTVYDIAIHRDDPDYMYCAYEGNASGPAVYRSTDGGDNWVGLDIEYAEGQYVQSASAIGVHPTHEEIVVVCEKAPTSGRLWGSVDATASTPEWKFINELRPRHPGSECNSIRFTYFYNSYPDGPVYQGYVAFNSVGDGGFYSGAERFAHC